MGLIFFLSPISPEPFFLFLLYSNIAQSYYPKLNPQQNVRHVSDNLSRLHVPILIFPKSIIHGTNTKLSNYDLPTTVDFRKHWGGVGWGTPHRILNPSWGGYHRLPSILNTAGPPFYSRGGRVQEGNPQRRRPCPGPLSGGLALMPLFAFGGLPSWGACQFKSVRPDESRSRIGTFLY